MGRFNSTLAMKHVVDDRCQRRDERFANTELGDAFRADARRSVARLGALRRPAVPQADVCLA